MRLALLTFCLSCVSCDKPVSSLSSSTHDEYWREYVTLQCETAATCDCEVQFNSSEECIDALLATTRARNGYYDELHFDPDCAERWMSVNRDLGCSFYRPEYPACNISYGDLEPGGSCDIINECTLGYRCLWGVCKAWHGGDGSRCESVSDCDEPLTCYRETCFPLPAEGEACLDGLCEGGLYCADALCVRVDPACGGCARNERCIDGACVVPKENGEPCTATSECRVHCHPYRNVCADYEPIMCLWAASWHLPGNE
jgi:hypothetical protein